MTSKRQMKLGAFLYPTGHHVAAWRHPQANARAGIDIEHYKLLAWACVATISTCFHALPFDTRRSSSR
jgi:hypothetical protein